MEFQFDAMDEFLEQWLVMRIESATLASDNICMCEIPYRKVTFLIRTYI
jgi:hypothetical protein